MFSYTKKVIKPCLWFTSMRGKNIPINGTPCLEELANLLKHLIATLSRHQTDGLAGGWKEIYIHITSLYVLTFQNPQ